MNNKLSDTIDAVHKAYQDPKIRKISRRTFVISTFAGAVGSIYLKPGGKQKVVNDFKAALMNDIQDISYNQFTEGLKTGKYKKLYVDGQTAYTENNDGAYGKVGLPSERHIQKLIESNEIDLDKIELHFNEKVRELSTSPAALKDYAFAHPDSVIAFLLARNAAKEIQGTIADYKTLKRAANDVKRICPDDKKATAYHEAGHAIILYLKPGLFELGKASIKYDGYSYGRVGLITPDKIKSNTKEELDNDLEAATAGRAAEIVMKGEKGYTTGGFGDISYAQHLADTMIRTGMSTQLGPVHLAPKDTVEAPKLRQLFTRAFKAEPYSDTRKVQIETARDEMVKKALEDATAFLKQHEAALHALAGSLLEHEELEPDQIKKIIDNNMPERNAAPQPSEA